MITKEEFVVWKNHPTTQKIAVLLAGMVKDERITLAKKCGLDSSYDRFRSGVLLGLEQAWDLESLFDFGDTTNAGTEGTQTSY